MERQRDQEKEQRDAARKSRRFNRERQRRDVVKAQFEEIGKLLGVGEDKTDRTMILEKLLAAVLAKKAALEAEGMQLVMVGDELRCVPAGDAAHAASTVPAAIGAHAPSSSSQVAATVKDEPAFAQLFNVEEKTETDGLGSHVAFEDDPYDLSNSSW
jgi:hypothetical protein